MTQRKTHRPAPPRSATPPDDLAAIASSLAHPKITRSGLTTTAGGEWALMVRVKPGTPTPIDDIEAAAAGHPVVYEDEPEQHPVARPAYPGRGE